MGKEQETSTSTESTQQNKIPKWLTQASKSLTGQALDLTNRDFVPYEGDRVAGFNPDQQTGFQLVRDLVSGAPNLLPETLGMARTYANAGPQQLDDLGRIVDETGPLGAIQDYLNPYQGALDTAIRRITEAADKSRLGLNARMTGAGAFGDARHGVEGAELNQNYMTAVGDTAADFMKNAYDTAMGLRGNDLNRFYNTMLAQSGLNETALQRLMQGAQGMLGLQGADQQQDIQRIATQLASGQTQQANAQAGLDAQYQDFLREMGWDPANLQLAANIISGIPYDTTSEFSGTTTQTSPDNSLWQLAGTLGGAALGGPIGASIGGSLFGGGATSAPGDLGWETSVIPA